MLFLAEKSIEFPNLHILIEDMPRYINVFGLKIAIYGIIMATSMVLGVLMACKMAKLTNQDPGWYVDFAIYAIIFSVIGARLYYVIFSWGYYKDNLLEVFNFRGGGLAIYGAVIAAVITAIVYSKIKKKSFYTIADTGIYGLLLGQITGRWGNFFNREAYGRAVSDKAFLAMRIYFDKNYSSSAVPSAVSSKMEEMTGKSIDALGYVQVQPTFLYESLWNLCLLILMIVFRKKKKFEGEILFWYLAGYGLGRAIIEGFRTDQLLIPGTSIPVSQVLSVILLIVSVSVICYKRSKAPAKKEEAVDNNN